MQLLCASNSLAFVHSLRIALDGENIQTYCTDADATLSSIAGPMTGIAARIYVLHEEDWARAVEVMRELDVGAEHEPAEESERGAAAQTASHPYWIWLVAGVVIAIVLAIVRNV